MDTQSHVLAGFLVLLWCCVLFYSMVGWGFLAARLLRIQSPGAGLAAALGITLQCFLGGVLNAVHLIYLPLLGFVILAGLLVAAREHCLQLGGAQRALQWWRARTVRDRLVLSAVVLLIFIRLISFVRVTAYNPWDDFQVYLLFPVKMLQVHYLPADPFSQRRVISSVGFCYYLSDLFLTLGPLKNMSLVDGGLGTLLLVTASLGISRALALSRRQAICFLLLAGFVKQIYFNLSFAWLPCGMFLAMTLIALRKDLREIRPRVQPICLGAVGAAATGLKNSYIVYSVLFILVFYVLLAFTSGAGRFERSTGWAVRVSFFLQSLAFSAFGFLGVLGLWMIDLHHYAGTFFYPILGQGYEYTAYHLLPSRIAHTRASVLKSLFFGFPLVVIALFEGLWARWNRLTALTVVVSIAAAMATVATALATGNDSVRRYCYPQMMLALLMVFPLVCAEANTGRKMRSGFWAKTAAVSLLLFGILFDYGKEHYAFNPYSGYVHRHFQDFMAGLRNRALNTDAEIAEYRALQAAAPPHSVILETVTYPYLLDNRNVTYFEASLPALASPPPAPGWPILSDGQALASWLRSQHVQYLMYSYGDHALQFDEYMPKLILDTNWPLILRTTWVATLKSHAQYLELSRTQHHVFDDGHIFILDLNRPADKP